MRRSTWRGVARALGVLGLLVGLVWIGQGTGVFPYPRESFMIDQMPWAWRGAALAVVGVLVILWSRPARMR